MNTVTLERWLSRAVLVASFLFLPIEILLVTAGGPAAFVQFVHLAPFVGIRGLTILLYSLVFALVVFPRYRHKSVWVLGVMWGLSECIWNPESLVVYPGSLNASAVHLSWWVYIGAISAFFVISVYMLRHNLRIDRLTLVMLAVMLLFVPIGAWIVTALDPAMVAASSTAASLPQVLVGDLPGYTLNIATALLLVRSVS